MDRKSKKAKKNVTESKTKNDKLPEFFLILDSKKFTQIHTLKFLEKEKNESDTFIYYLKSFSDVYVQYNLSELHQKIFNGYLQVGLTKFSHFWIFEIKNCSKFLRILLLNFS